MHQTRLPLAAILISATILLSLLPAQSATIAGTKCTKLNSSKTVANIKYTCVKSGGQLLWNKGIVAKAYKPTPTPISSKPPADKTVDNQIKVGDYCTSAERGVTKKTNTETFICKHDGSEAFRWYLADLPETPLPSLTPIPTPTNVSSYYGSVYQDLGNYLSPNFNNLKITWHISDNAKDRKIQKFIESAELGARIWYTDFNNSEINIILFTEKDADWVDQKQRYLMGNWLTNPSEQLQSNRLKVNGCEIGGFYFPNIILGCVRDRNDSRNIFDASKMFVHEFTHLSGFTSMQLTSMPIGDISRFRPGWVEEGMGTFFGFFGASQLDPNFKENRFNLLNNMRTSIDRKSTDSIIQMFRQLEKSDYATNVQDSYFLGSLAFEFLGNKYGISKIFETNRLFFKGVPWKSAFLQVYGFPIDNIYEKVAEAVVSKIWIY